jgi:hypothetical protein
MGSGFLRYRFYFRLLFDIPFSFVIVLLDLTTKDETIRLPPPTNADGSVRLPASNYGTVGNIYIFPRKVSIVVYKNLMPVSFLQQLVNFFA